MLSRGAEIDTKPQLEIFADDVQCGHGTTVGQLDPDAMFYLRARGLGETEARRMLSLGFAAEVLDCVSVAGLRDQAVALLEQRLDCSPRARAEEVE
jgi:Fe-S cluster assembly protein SufD